MPTGHQLGKMAPVVFNGTEKAGLPFHVYETGAGFYPILYRIMRCFCLSDPSMGSRRRNPQRTVRFLAIELVKSRKIPLCALSPEPSDSRRDIAKTVGFKYLHAARFGNDVLQGTGFAVRVPKG